MTDEPLVAKRLAFIETCVRELRTIADVEVIDHDLREERFIEVDREVVKDVVRNRLDDLLGFVVRVRARLGG